MNESTPKAFFTTKDTKYTKEFFMVCLKGSNVCVPDLQKSLRSSLAPPAICLANRAGVRASRCKDLFAVQS
jgi:hypothetical protein